MEFLEEYKGLLIWLIMYFVVFTGSWIPIWRNSETRRRLPNSRPGKGAWTVVTHYGWQTRKRKQKEEGRRAAWWLMNPRMYYEGVVWVFLYILISVSSCWGLDMSGETGGSALVAGALLTLIHAAWFGMWTIAPFYWDMPFWGCVHLTSATLLSASVAVLYAILNLNALWLYLPFLIAQIYMSGGNWIAWFAAGAGKNRTTRIGNPVRAFFAVGLNPISYTFRDV